MFKEFLGLQVLAIGLLRTHKTVVLKFCFKRGQFDFEALMGAVLRL